MTSSFTLNPPTVGTDASTEPQRTESKSHSQDLNLLKDVVDAICFDARRDSLRYALRSNVGHDGE